MFFFFFNDTATTEIYTLSLHDALPISGPRRAPTCVRPRRPGHRGPARHGQRRGRGTRRAAAGAGTGRGRPRGTPGRPRPVRAAAGAAGARRRARPRSTSAGPETLAPDP